MQQFDRYRVLAEGENMPITQDGIPSVMARNGGIAMKHGGALSTVAKRVQAAGAGEDKILVHINPTEYAELVRKYGPATYNDQTGLPQLGFFKSLGKILKTVAPIAISFIPGVNALSLPLQMALGAGIGAATSGGKLSGALKGAALSGLGSALGGAYNASQSITPAVNFSPLSGLGANTVAEAGLTKGGVDAFTKSLGDSLTTGLIGGGSSKLGKLAGLATSPLGLGALGLAASSSKKSGPLTPPPGWNPPWLSTSAKNMGPSNLVVPNLGMPRTPLTGNQLAAKNIDWFKFGETPRSAETQSFFRTEPQPVLSNLAIPTTINPEPTVVPELVDQNYLSSFKRGGALSRYVKGAGDGQADKIPAMLSDGEYVMDAETVSALGNGSSEAGAKKLDEFRMNLRKHKRSAPIGKIPPKTKDLSKYMSGGSK